MTVSVAYHADGYGPARPAVNVKCGSPWGAAEYALADSLGSVERAEGYLETAFESLAARFWSDAAEMALALGLGPIEQEGRSGGWLVLTDGRDPQDMAVACDSTVESIRYEAQSERASWLAAYRQLADWCAEQVRTAPARVAALAQQLAMDEIGAEPARRMFAVEIAEEGPHYEPEGVPA